MQRGGEPDAGGASETLAAAHAKLLHDRGFQFDRAVLTPPTPPEWLRWFDWLPEAIRAAAPVLKWVFWIGAALLLALIVYAVGREVLGLRLGPARPKQAAPLDEPEWRPDPASVRDLLAAADQLAAEGRYAEAAHLILLRSVEDIQGRLPDAVRPALTTREIASLSALPPGARPAFAKIGRLVERSLFGGAMVDAVEFAACRSDYEAFALPDGWRG